MANDKTGTVAPGLGTRRTRRGIAVVVLVASFAAGCAGSSVSSQPAVLSSEPNIQPTNYKAEILAYLRTYLNDPTGIRDALITEPALKQLPGTQRYASCLRFNAKNSIGKYEGNKDRFVAFLSGRLDTMVNARGDQCANANWQPFPELQKLTR